MKHFGTILAFIFCTLLTFGQKKKLPPKGTKYPMSKFRFNYPLQTGNLQIVKIDSLNQIILRTDNSDLKFDREHVFDTVAIALFQRGILTSDILLKAINEEAKYIDYKGDIFDYTKHIVSKTVKLMNIQQEPIPKYIKKKEGVMFLKIAVTFTEYKPNSFLPVIYDFNLFLKADCDPNLSNFEEYLKRVNTKYLQFTGEEI